MKTVNVGFVEAAMRDLLERNGEPLIYHDPANGQRLRIDPGVAGAADGLLPAILVAGESVWRDLTGKGFELDLAREPSALLGYRVCGIGGPSVSIVMLAAIEALAQVTGPDGMIVNEFNALWVSSIRQNQRRQAAGTPDSGVRP
jgi:hypothetical protein